MVNLSTVHQARQIRLSGALTDELPELIASVRSETERCARIAGSELNWLENVHGDSEAAAGAAAAVLAGLLSPTGRRSAVTASV